MVFLKKNQLRQKKKKFKRKTSGLKIKANNKNECLKKMKKFKSFLFLLQ
jgi:hypothetical protein